MPVIINIRGTSGSGKTTAVRSFLNFPFNTLHHKVTSSKGRTTEKVAGYQIQPPSLKHPVYLVGSYENVCGGLDGVGTQDDCAQMITKAYGYGNVLCEGLLLSSVAANATVPAAMINAAGRDRVIFAFIDTPINVCLDRVRARRDARGTTKPFNEANTRKKYEDTFRARQNLIDQGCRVVDIDHLNAGAQLLALFQDNE